MNTSANQPAIAMRTSIEIRKPDDWHLHLRDGAALQHTVPAAAERFARAVIMPNLKSPVKTTEEALNYRERIMAHVPAALTAPAGSRFQPLMTLYLHESTSAAEIERAAKHPEIIGIKLYPAGATTNSEAGVGELKTVYSALEAMQKFDLPLLIHGESTERDHDVFDREKRFLEDTFAPLTERFPQLRMVLEHITTREAVQYIEQSRPGIAATITAHHLLCNRTDMFRGGIRPHYYCLPVLKREEDRQALLQAATGGSPKFFAGTDSAPHARRAKESACGCAGIYTAPAAVEFYIEAFAEAASLNRIEDFLSSFGADFYGLPRNEKRVRYERAEFALPAELPMGDGVVVPFRAGETLGWKLDS